MSYAIMHSIKIIEVLHLHFGSQPPEAFRVMLDRAIRSKHLTTAQLRAIKLKVQILEQWKEAQGYARQTNAASTA